MNFDHESIPPVAGTSKQESFDERVTKQFWDLILRSKKDLGLTLEDRKTLVHAYGLMKAGLGARVHHRAAASRLENVVAVLASPGTKDEKLDRIARIVESESPSNARNLSVLDWWLDLTGPDRESISNVADPLGLASKELRTYGPDIPLVHIGQGLSEVQIVQRFAEILGKSPAAVLKMLERGAMRALEQGLIARRPVFPGETTVTARK